MYLRGTLVVNNHGRIHMNDEDYRLLDSRLDEISERLAKTEGELLNRTKKGLRQKLSEGGGLVALFLSLIIGGVTIYENFVSKPRQSIKAQELAIRADIADLGNISAQIAALPWRFDPAGASAQASLYQPRKTELVARLTDGLEKSPHVFHYVDLMLLVIELENVGRYDTALSLLATAFDQAENSIERANVFWSRGRIFGRQGNIADMNFNYELAITEFRLSGMRNTAWNIMEVYVQWASWTMGNKSCEHALDIHSKFVSDLAHVEVFDNTRQHFKLQFNKMLLDLQPITCGLEPFDDLDFETGFLN